MSASTHHVRRTFVEGSYGQIHCRVAAPAERQPKGTIVCLHMSPKSGGTFKTLLPHLADQYVVLAPDYPGYGESDPPPAEPHVRVEDYAEAVWQVVDQLGADSQGPLPVHLVGYHTGSMVAVEAATQRSDAVHSVTNISAPLFSAEELERLHNTYAPIPLDEQGTRFKTMWERILFHRGPGMTLQMAAASMAENLRGGEHYEWGHRAAFNYAPSYAERLAALATPLLVLNPNDDCVEQTRRVDPLLRNGRRVDLPDWGHGFLEVFAPQAAGLITDFVESVS